MASEISELMHRNLFQVFGERDAERREAVIAEIYSEEVAFSDPEGTVTGRAALAGKVKISGTDVALIEGGLITRLYTLLD